MGGGVDVWWGVEMAEKRETGVDSDQCIVASIAYREWMHLYEMFRLHIQLLPIFTSRFWEGKKEKGKTKKKRWIQSRYGG